MSPDHRRTRDREVERRTDRLRGRGRVRQLHAADDPRQGGRVLAQRRRERGARRARGARRRRRGGSHRRHRAGHSASARESAASRRPDRKSTRLNSSHLVISYAVFCLKKKKKIISPFDIIMVNIKLTSQL